MFKFLWKMIKWSFVILVALVVIGLLLPTDPEAEAKRTQARIAKCLVEIGAGSCDENGYETQESKDKRALIEIDRKAKADARIAAAKAKEVAEEKRKGFHCLSDWDGSHTAVVRATKKQLRDPKSFDHSKTMVWPVSVDGKHQFVMQYRAKNGFGGLTMGVVKGEYSNETCQATIRSID